MADLVHCRWCGRPIRWTKTAAGKAMPLDPQPVPHLPPPAAIPTVVVDEATGTCRVLTKAELDAPAGAAEVRWVTHWATCAYARKVRDDYADRRRARRGPAAAGTRTPS